MTFVKLFTASGEFVAEVEIPPFDTFPEVLIWGSRVFRLGDDDVYREAFAFWTAPRE